MRENSSQWYVPDNTDQVFLTSLDAQGLSAAIKRHLLPEGAGEGAVIWVDGDSEVVVEIERWLAQTGNEQLTLSGIYTFICGAQGSRRSDEHLRMGKTFAKRLQECPC
jgi:hypothetical protein